jgi:hypothetical protein
VSPTQTCIDVPLNTIPIGAFADRRATHLQLAWIDAADDTREAHLAWRDADRVEAPLSLRRSGGFGVPVRGFTPYRVASLITPGCRLYTQPARNKKESPCLQANA